MFVESSKDSAASRATAKPLRRGRACLNCRFLKIKCDGVKPICGPCRKHPKDDQCEYADGSGRSRTKMLEDKVSRLEARLGELEHLEESTPSVALHDPYIRTHESVSQLPLSLPIIEARSTDSSSPPASSSSSLLSTQPWRNFGALESKPDLVGSNGSSSSQHRQDTSSPLRCAEEPGFLTIKSLLDRFLPHCQEFGFFLNPNRFREATLLPLSFGHPRRPTPALLSAVYLWGVHLSQPEALLQEEPSFISRALQHAATGLFGSHPDAILHTLQAEILLSYYLLRIGRFLEAKCHTAVAVSLALGADLHKIRSAHPITPSAVLGLSSDASVPFLLPLPRDHIEEGERINGFWAVVVLHKCIMVTLESPLSVCGALEAPGIQIDTPWPLDILTYSEGLSPDLRGDNTIREFLYGIVEDGHGFTNMTGLKVQAVILFHKSAELAGQSMLNMQPYDLQLDFHSIRRLVDKFSSNLPPFTHATVQPWTRTLLFIHALADAAVITLHNHFSYTNLSSQQCRLGAARRIVTFYGFNVMEVGLMNSFMGTLLVLACNVCIDELRRVRSSGDVWSANIEGTEDDLVNLLRSGMAALRAQSDESILMRYQLRQIQEACSAI